MNKTLWDQSAKLANQRYAITIEEDHLSNGQAIFLLTHPELPGCKAQGFTLEEAKKNLDDARRDYIYALLELGEEVPEPATSQSTTQSVATNELYYFDASNPETENISSPALIVTEHKNSVEISFGGDLVKYG